MIKLNDIGSKYTPVEWVKIHEKAKQLNAKVKDVDYSDCFSFVIKVLESNRDMFKAHYGFTPSNIDLFDFDFNSDKD